MRKGITLIELLVVLTILVSMVAVGGGLMSSQVSMFTERASVDEVVSLFRRAQSLARSRGLPYDANLLIAPTTPGVVYGVAIFDGTFPSDPALPIQPGQSIMLYSQSGNGGSTPDPLEPNVKIPTGALATLDALQKTACTPIRPGLKVVKQWTPGADYNSVPTISNGQPFVKFQFYSNGDFDVYQNGAIMNSSLGALVQEVTIPQTTSNPGLVGGGFSSWTFDLVHVSAGWMRVRIRPGGVIENSAIAPLTSPVYALRSENLF